MCNLDMSTFVVLCLFCVLGICLIFGGVWDEIKFNRFCSRLYVGNKLCNVVKSICNEFDEGHLFIVTITKVGNKQVMVRFDDGSESIMYKRQLFFEGWKFMNEL